MKLNKIQKKTLREKIAQQKNWYLMSLTYPGKVRESYILLYQSILEEQDREKNKWRSLIRTIGGKGE